MAFQKKNRYSTMRRVFSTAKAHRIVVVHRSPKPVAGVRFLLGLPFFIGSSPFYGVDIFFVLCYNIQKQ